MTVDVYMQYYSADLTWNGVERRGAAVRLTADSETGQIRYTASVSFFPHVADDDFSVSYDAYFEKELYRAAGRRSKKRESVFLENLRSVIDELAEDAGGKVLWDRPLGEARRG